MLSSGFTGTILSPELKMNLSVADNHLSKT